VAVAVHQVLMAVVAVQVDQVVEVTVLEILGSLRVEQQTLAEVAVEVHQITVEYRAVVQEL
jgi:hypothetical protein